jgi:2-methylcitrate dehydratase PrpD
VFEGWGGSLSLVEPGASYKLYPCCYSTHSAIQGALELVKEHGRFDPSTIERIESRTSSRALAHTDRPHPKSSLEAKFSVQYCVARALVHGQVALDHFEGRAHDEPAIQSLLARTQSSPYPGPFFSEDRFDARLKVTLTDGRVLEAKVDSPVGRTASDAIPKEALDTKFLDCASRVLPVERSAAVCKAIWTIDSLGAVRDLTAMLETAGRKLEAVA